MSVAYASFKNIISYDVQGLISRVRNYSFSAVRADWLGETVLPGLKYGDVVKLDIRELRALLPHRLEVNPADLAELDKRIREMTCKMQCHSTAWPRFSTGIGFVDRWHLDQYEWARDELVRLEALQSYFDLAGSESRRWTEPGQWAEWMAQMQIQDVGGLSERLAAEMEQMRITERAVELAGPESLNWIQAKHWTAWGKHMSEHHAEELAALRWNSDWWFDARRVECSPAKLAKEMKLRQVHQVSDQDPLSARMTRLVAEMKLRKGHLRWPAVLKRQVYREVHSALLRQLKMPQ